MKVLRAEKRLCACCMEEHVVKTVLVTEKATFKDTVVNYEARYEYCDAADEFYMDEQEMSDNDTRLKDAYRKEVGLLTSGEVTQLRAKYGISQKDLCLLLGWGGKTVTRYESHQVQDKAHDTILKKLDHDPEWFIALLEETREELTNEAYLKYLANAVQLYEEQQDQYQRKAIEAAYAKYRGNALLCGNNELSLDKVVESIRYYAASPKVTNLYKVKLMKMLWYADALSYKSRGAAITGLVYRALPMGAVPESHNKIIDLKGVPCEEIEINYSTAYRFDLQEPIAFAALTEEDLKVLDTVADRLGGMNTDEIVEFMHREEAYRKTTPHELISFAYADSLQI